MATGKPPRRPKASSEPVTIDLQAEPSDAAAPDEGLKPEDLHADEATMAAPEGDPVEPKESETPQETAPSAAESMAKEPLEPPHSPAKKSPSTSAMLAAGIAGGLVSLALAGSMHYAGYLPLGGSSTTTETISPELSGRLATIESSISTLATAAPAQQIDETLGPRLDALETAIAGIREQVATGPTDSTLANLRGELAALAENLGQLKTAVDANRQSVKATDSRLAEAERKINEPRTDVEMARAIAATALKGAVDRGGPFLAELDTLAGIAPDEQALSGLRPFASTGVPSRAELARRFPDVANSILTAIHQPNEGEGIGARLLSSAFSVIKVRPVGNVEGETPEAIIARIEDKMRNGDFKGAVIEWDTLPDAGKAASSEYATLLRNRVEVETLAGTAMSAAVGTNG